MRKLYLCSSTNVRMPECRSKWGPRGAASTPPHTLHRLRPPASLGHRADL